MLKWRVLAVVGLSCGVAGVAWGYAQRASDPGFFEYMRGYPSRDARDARLAAAHADPEFREVVTAVERDPDARLIESVQSLDLIPTDYSALR